MIKTLRITSILAVALAAILVVFSVVFGVRSDKDIEKLLGGPNVIEKFNSAGKKATRGSNQVSPLVQQAGVFALYLNPPKPVASRPVKGRASTVKRAPSATPKFKVMGTSYYKGRPESSMALIDEPGKGLHWVRQSSMVGHLLIEEVKDGIVVIKDNNGTFELAAEQKPHISLLEGAPAVPSKQAGISSSTVGSSVSRSSAAASVKSSTGYSGKTGSRVVKPPRPPLPRKTAAEESAMTELAEKLAQLQKSFQSDKTGSGLTDQEKAEMMNELIEEFRAKRSSILSTEDEERLSILGKELKKKMEEPTSSDQK
ncbi:MAG: hypothetical protein HQ580_02435 [Planctomycetes bacterium]|nr:hypothetical protein [Planctomycetota bacterium]